MRVLPAFVVTALLGTLALPALADSDIDVVYGDDLARRGELATELAARWSRTARQSDFAGRTLWQAVGELAYGVGDNLNIGIKVPVSRVDGNWHGHGAYAELKYLAPRRAQGFTGAPRSKPAASGSLARNAPSSSKPFPSWAIASAGCT